MKTANFFSVIFAGLIILSASVGYAQMNIYTLPNGITVGYAHLDVYSLPGNSKIHVSSSNLNLVHLTGKPARLLYDKIDNPVNDTRLYNAVANNDVRGELFKFIDGIGCKRQIYGKRILSWLSSDPQYDEDYFCDVDMAALKRSTYIDFNSSWHSTFTISADAINIYGESAKRIYRALLVPETDMRSVVPGQFAKFKNNLLCIYNDSKTYQYNCQIKKQN